jgi:hypothetical protein
MTAETSGITTDVILTLAVTAGALGLFLWNRLRVDVVGIIVMVTLIVLGLVTPREGISGFANEAVITVRRCSCSRPACCAPAPSTCSAAGPSASPAAASSACWSSRWRWSCRSARSSTTRPSSWSS